MPDTREPVVDAAPDEPAVNPPYQDLLGSWTLIRIKGGEASSGTTLVIADEGKVTGSGGCNTYNTLMTLESGTLSMGMVGSTRMMCEAPTMTQESAYFEALAKVNAAQIKGDRLTMTGPEDISLTFTRGINENNEPDDMGM